MKCFGREGGALIEPGIQGSKNPGNRGSWTWSWTRTWSWRTRGLTSWHSFEHQCQQAANRRDTAHTMAHALVESRPGTLMHNSDPGPFTLRHWSGIDGMPPAGVGDACSNQKIANHVAAQAFLLLYISG